MPQPIPKCAQNRTLAALVREPQSALAKKTGNRDGIPIQRSAAIPVLVRLADRFDILGAHAMADVADEAARLVRIAQAAQTPQQQLAQQQAQQTQLQQLADRFLNIHTEMLNATRLFSNPATIPSGMKRLLDAAREIGLAANALKQSVTTTTTTVPAPIPATTTAVPGGPTIATEAVRELVALANRFDTEGNPVLADLADRAAEMVLKFSDKKKEEEEELPIKPGHLAALSSRYCPDHRGVQAFRVSDRVFQCPIDGRMYDYEGGYVDYNGQMVPGGSIANQTPNTMPYQLPQRLYDPNQYVLNTMN
jgi:hypothetical protein